MLGVFFFSGQVVFVNAKLFKEEDTQNKLGFDASKRVLGSL